MQQPEKIYENCAVHAEICAEIAGNLHKNLTETAARCYNQLLNEIGKGGIG